MSNPTDKTARKLKYGTNVVAATVLFLVVLGVINFFAARSRMRADLTRDKQYTVSEATKGMLGSLKDQVDVTVYATEQNTPPDWTDQRNQLKNLLYEYRRLSNGKLTYKFTDPSVDPKLAREAEQAGVREQAMQQASSTEYSVKAGFLGFIVQYKGKKEVVPIIRPDSSVEYQLTRAINKVAQVNIPTIGIMAPGGNPYMGEQGNFALVPELLQIEGYTVKQLEATQLRKELSPDKINLLMVFQPEELSDEALYHIDQYIMHGGKMFVATSGVTLDQRQGRVSPKSSNINLLLESYGMKVDQDMLEDWGRGMQQQFLTMRGVVASRNPLIMEVTDLSSESPITRKLRRLVLVLASSISMTGAESTSGSVEVLARTSDRTRRQEQMFELDQQKLKQPKKDEKLDSFPVVVSAKGPLQSRYAKADPPADDGG